MIKINKKDITIKSIYAYYDEPLLFSATYKGVDYLLLAIDPLQTQGRYLVCHNKDLAVGSIAKCSPNYLRDFIESSSLWITEYDESEKVKAYPIKYEDLPANCLPDYPYITGVKLNGFIV